MTTEFNLSENTVLKSEWLSDYTNYYFYIENKNNYDEPLEGKFILYDLFDDAISCLNEENEITIGEKILSKTQILSTNNFNQITSIFGEITPEIDYDDINILISKINVSQEYSEISTILYNWIGRYINLDINKNPENADESNLILVKGLLNKDAEGKCYIQKITEALLNKIFRNFIQLVRVKHEYRLYGEGTTIIGGKSTELSSDQKLEEWSALPASCWTQFAGNYIVGKKAYGDEITSISSQINGVFNINPSTCYGIAPHHHTITSSKISVPTTISTIPDGAEHEQESFSVIARFSKPPKLEATNYVKSGIVDNYYKPWNERGRNELLSTPQGFADPSEICAKIMGGGKWSYFWNSKGCKLNTEKNMTSDIFKESNVVLPTYSTYVWQWTGIDDTNITSPKKYIK